MVVFSFPLKTGGTEVSTYVRYGRVG